MSKPKVQAFAREPDGLTYLIVGPFRNAHLATAFQAWLSGATLVREVSGQCSQVDPPREYASFESEISEEEASAARRDKRLDGRTFSARVKKVKAALREMDIRQNEAARAIGYSTMSQMAIVRQTLCQSRSNFVVLRRLERLVQSLQDAAA